MLDYAPISPMLYMNNIVYQEFLTDEVSTRVVIWQCNFTERRCGRWFWFRCSGCYHERVRVYVGVTQIVFELAPLAEHIAELHRDCTCLRVFV